MSDSSDYRSSREQYRHYYTDKKYGESEERERRDRRRQQHHSRERWDEREERRRSDRNKGRDRDRDRDRDNYRDRDRDRDSFRDRERDRHMDRGRKYKGRDSDEDRGGGHNDLNIERDTERNERKRDRDEQPENDEIESIKRSRTDDMTENETGTFIWRKKVDLERKKGRVVNAETEAARLKSLRVDLEDAKRARAQRDKERLERMEAQREKEKQRYENENQMDREEEESFVGRQHFIRQAIRIQEGRTNVVDEIARVIRLDLISIDDDHRHHVDVMDLIKRYGTQKDFINHVNEELDYIDDFSTDFDTQIFHKKTRALFWKTVHDVATFDSGTNNNNPNRTKLVHHAVLDDVNALLTGKSVEKLEEMQHEIKQQLSSSSDLTNSNQEKSEELGENDFWYAALSRIKYLLATYRLESLVRSLRSERARLKKEQQQQQQQEKKKRQASSSLSLSSPSSSSSQDNNNNNENNDVISKHHHNSTKNMLHERELMRIEAARGMGEDESAFTDEVFMPSASSSSLPLNNKHTHPSSSNGRRKPLYFNRVHTGYNWSKYNRTHYDHDNPPPKTVRGYKFNIFYPDLQDTSQPPTYSIRKTDNPDVSIITFKAGAPYDDIAFKIVNRPWERSHKKGFRSSFDRGVLQLWFHFQHYRYRR